MLGPAPTHIQICRRSGHLRAVSLGVVGGKGVLVDHADLRRPLHEYRFHYPALAMGMEALEGEPAVLLEEGKHVAIGEALVGERLRHRVRNSSRLKKTSGPCSTTRLTSGGVSSRAPVAPSSSRWQTKRASSSAGVLPMMPARKYGVWVVRKNWFDVSSAIISPR